MTRTIIKETGSITSDSMVLPYLIREPQIKSEKKKAVILLHGVGSNEQDLFSLANHLPQEFYVISARAPFTLGAGRYAWYHVDFSTGKPVYNAAQEASGRKMIMEFMEQVKRKYKLDEIYLGGFSQGAIMSYSIGLTHPDEVQGVIALSGRVLNEIKPFVAKEENLKRVKVFVAHGVQDNTLAVHYAREAKHYLEDLGVKLTYKEYPIGHQITNEVLQDLNRWLK